MQLPNHYSYGQLFCFSGLDGETSREYDFAGMLLKEPVNIRFHFDKAVTLSLPIKSKKFDYVLGDFIKGEDIEIVFINKHTVVGKSKVMPVIKAECDIIQAKEKDTIHYIIDNKDFYLTVEEKNGMYYFDFSYKVIFYKIYNNEELESIIKERISYFEKLPKCKDSEYEQLYYKCMSINKENVYSKEGIIPFRWTTPDRIPHRFMWLWDSVFHALSFKEYNLDMAKEAIKSVLITEREDGFIAHMMSFNGQISNVTQPQVIAWGVWNIYLKDKDKKFLEFCAPYISKFLLWTIENRDKNNNGLLEWFTEQNYDNCHCGESGLDNSPRFDFDENLDAIDFSCYLCNDAKYLSKIYAELGDKQNQKLFNDIYEKTKEKINTLMWCEEDGLYYDRLFDGNLTKVSSASTFLPLTIGICSKEQADKLVKNLLDKNSYWLDMPIPSIPKNSKLYDTDMWRGCTWLNINYFTMLGLKKYGYIKEAEEIRVKTLKAVNKWYNKTGNVFEFYDADNKICPFMLKRKGDPIDPPDYRKHVHAITDYNWSACFAHLMINKIELA